MPDLLLLSEQIQLACILECTAPKPGNVSPEFSFDDLTCDDFLKSAAVVAPILAESRQQGVGTAIRDAVIATRNAVGTNTNLGMLLLLAPLAAVPPGKSCGEGIEAALQSIDLDQTGFIYEAIRLAQPGGLGKADAQDVSEAPQVPIVEAMALAPHDRIAWQYTHSFIEVLETFPAFFLAAVESDEHWKTAIVRTHLELIAAHSDSLILRKCGKEIAQQAKEGAQVVLKNWPAGSDPPAELNQYDDWLRADGHRRNPGTTADLIAAMLFSLIRDGRWSPPADATALLKSCF